MDNHQQDGNHHINGQTLLATENDPFNGGTTSELEYTAMDPSNPWPMSLMMALLGY